MFCLGVTSVFSSDCVFQKHIKKGCLSGIEPGHGTNMNERFHRKLNRCLVVGVSLIGPELISALLTVLFYHHNKSLSGKRHTCNSEIVPVPHPHLEVVYNHHNALSKHILEKVDELLPDADEFLGDVHADKIFGKVHINIHQQYQTLKAMKDRCVNRTMTIYDMIPFDLVESNPEEARLV